VRTCIEQSLNQALQLVGAQGGYVFLPPGAVIRDTTGVAYGVRNRVVVLPSEEAMEAEMARYISSGLRACVDTEDFRKQGYSLGDGPIEVTVTSTATDTRASVNWRAAVTAANTTYMLNARSGSVLLSFASVYASVKSAAENAAAGDSVDITALAADGYSHEIVPLNSSAFLVVTRTGNISSQSYTFVFAVEEHPNHPPVIAAPASMTLGREEVRTIAVNVSDQDGDRVTLRAQSPLATLRGSQLEIRSSVAGTFTINLIAEDDRHATSSTSIEVTVTP
jgi:hypothetical protein